MSNPWIGIWPKIIEMFWHVCACSWLALMAGQTCVYVWQYLYRSAIYSYSLLVTIHLASIMMPSFPCLCAFNWVLVFVSDESWIGQDICHIISAHRPPYCFYAKCRSWQTHVLALLIGQRSSLLDGLITSWSSSWTLSHLTCFLFRFDGSEQICKWIIT